MNIGSSAPRTALGVMLVALLLTACSREKESVDTAHLRDFATRYTAAWCGRDAAGVAAFFAADGSLQINGGTPSVGRTAIAYSAQDFMTAFPDLVVAMDTVSREPGTDERPGQAIYRWTLSGTNTGPDGTGRPVHISGYEEWTLGPDGLIAASLGHFDAADYDRQLQAGTE
jgi:hypothetical protein